MNTVFTVSSPAETSAETTASKTFLFFPRLIHKDVVFLARKLLIQLLVLLSTSCGLICASVCCAQEFEDPLIP